MKLFFFGGSFDPPHLGHEAVARKCKEICDKFIFFPCKRSPAKTLAPIASEFHRIQMTRIMADSLGKKFTVDDFELGGSSPSYTINTVDYLKNKYLNADLSMVVGADQMENIDKWKDYDTIVNLLTIVCFDRDKIARNIGCKFIEMDHNISSSEIRKNIKSQKTKLNFEVFKYIINNNVYTNK